MVDNRNRGVPGEVVYRRVGENAFGDVYYGRYKVGELDEKGICGLERLGGDGVLFDKFVLGYYGISKKG